MDPVEKAQATQMANIAAKTGKSLEALFGEILAQGMAKHGEMVSWAKDHYGLGHGDANTLVHLARRAAEAAPASEDPLDAIYAGKEHLRPIHEALMARFEAFGPFEIAPKKANVSLRRKKQFALLGPKTKTRFELGLNLKEEAEHPLLKA